MRFKLAVIICSVLLSSLGASAEGFRPLSASKSQSSEASLDHYLDTAALFKENGEYVKAIDVLQHAEGLERDVRLRRYLGRLLFLNGDVKEAQRIFENQKQKDWLDYLYLGLIHEGAGKNAAALTYYQQSLKLRRSSIALFRAGKIYRKQKQYKSASEYFSKLLSFDPSIRLAHYYLGQCLLEQRQYQEAHKALSKASQFYPQATAIKKHLLIARRALGEDFFRIKKKEKEKKRKSVVLASYLPEKEAPSVRIGLADNLSEFSFSCAGGFRIANERDSFKGKAHTYYRIKLKKGMLLVTERNQGQPLARMAVPVTISTQPDGGRRYPFYVLDVNYGKDMFWHKKIDRAYRGDLRVRAENQKIVLINIVSIEEYIQGVLSAEIPASSPHSALRAQAIAARTIAYRNRNRHKKRGYDFCADVHCQVYHGLSAETTATNDAVRKTRGVILVYNDKPIEAFYHANSGGCLSADTFGNIDFLQEKLDAKVGELPVSAYQQQAWFRQSPLTYSRGLDKSAYRWQRNYDREDFLIVFGWPLKSLRSITVEDEGDCFHLKAVKLITTKEEKRLEGDLNIRNYFDSLRSSAFGVELQYGGRRIPEHIFFWGAGFGHGAGMSQEGAIALAGEGIDHKKILSHYYPQARLTTVR